MSNIESDVFSNMRKRARKIRKRHAPESLDFDPCTPSGAVRQEFRWLTVALALALDTVEAQATVITGSGIESEHEAHVSAEIQLEEFGRRAKMKLKRLEEFSREPLVCA